MKIELPDPPTAWARRIAGYGWLPHAGASDASVFRLHAAGKPTLFVKTERLSPLAELPDEIQRLNWLSARGVPCPTVLDTAQTAEHAWLLMSEVPGTSLHCCKQLSANRIIQVTAAALRRLHALDVADCPFNHRIEQRVAQALTRVQAGRVDEDDFDAEHRGITAPALYAKLLGQLPVHEDPVVTHGDACLSNLMTHDRQFSGFIDCGRLGVADRHQDLALASRDIAESFGMNAVARFFAAYGTAVDPQRIAIYRLLDEFF